MKFKDIQRILKGHQWLFSAAIFFVFWKFFLIGILWSDRAIPPEPDDSYEYVAHIASVSRCDSGITCPYPGVSFSDHSGFSYLSYRLFLGGIGRIFDIPPEILYHFGFFLGTILLLPVLVIFLRSLTPNKHLVAWSIFFLAFYHGTGETHGFFWVVPSFFSALLFFLLFFLVSGKQALSRKFLLYTGTATIAFVFSHPMSVYITLILPLFSLTFFAISRHIDKILIQKILIVVSISLFASLGQGQYLKQKSQINYYGITQSAQQTKESIENIIFPDTAKERTSKAYILGYSVTRHLDTGLFYQRLETLRVTYFRYVTPHWLALLPFLVALWILWKKQEYHVISLYASSLVFFIAATFFHEFGFRSAIILWPVTFVLFAFASWHGFSFVLNMQNRILRKTLLFVGVFGAIAFFIANAILGLTFNINVNTRNHYPLDEGFSKYLLKKTSPRDTINLSPILVRTAGGSKLYFRNNFVPLSKNPKYFAVIDPSLETPHLQESSTLRSLARPATRLFGIPLEDPSIPASPDIPNGYTLDATFGVIKIYRNIQ